MLWFLNSGLKITTFNTKVTVISLYKKRNPSIPHDPPQYLWKSSYLSVHPRDPSQYLWKSSYLSVSRPRRPKKCTVSVVSRLATGCELSCGRTVNTRSGGATLASSWAQIRSQAKAQHHFEYIFKFIFTFYFDYEFESIKNTNYCYQFRSILM